MAATKRNAMRIEEARQKIRTTQLINRLQDHALGKVDMSSTQVKSVEVLLRKSLPDLATVELTGKDGGPVEIADVSPIETARRLAFLLGKGLRAQEGT